MARGGKAHYGKSKEWGGRRLILVHHCSRRRVLPGPLTPRRGVLGDRCVSVLSWGDFLLTQARRPAGWC
uniref:Uncharacterized protein n=1 Tax=Desulfobacca acetoxidans TaxID=60893 RepID=A0A7V4GA96_9BACT